MARNDLYIHFSHHKSYFSAHINQESLKENPLEHGGQHRGTGLLSGIDGTCFACSISTNVSPAIYLGAGCLAISAMIFGNWKVISTLGACLIFGFARSAAQQLVLLLKMDGARDSGGSSVYMHPSCEKSATSVRNDWLKFQQMGVRLFFCTLLGNLPCRHLPHPSLDNMLSGGYSYPLNLILCLKL
jgi:hypothetical protein